MDGCLGLVSKTGVVDTGIIDTGVVDTLLTVPLGKKVAVSQELASLVRTDSIWRTPGLLVPRVPSSVARTSSLVHMYSRLFLSR